MHFLTDRETQGFLLCMSSCLFSLFTWNKHASQVHSVLWFLRLCTASHNLDWVSIVWSVLTARVVQISTCTIKWCQSNTNSSASVRLINCTDLDLLCYESHCFVLGILSFIVHMLFIFLSTFKCICFVHLVLLWFL